MRKLFFILSFLFLLVLQLTIMPRLIIFGVFPNILLAAILFFVIKKDGHWPIVVAFTAGLAMDFFSSSPLGIYSLAFILVAWLAIHLGKGFFKINTFSGEMSLVAAACFSYSVLVIFFTEFFNWFGAGPVMNFWPSLLKVILPEFILNSIMALIFVLLLKKIYGLFAKF